jgi:hypothetical protein
MPKENEVLRRQTKQFIEEYPMEILLQRSDMVPDGSGGFKATLGTVPAGAQTFRQVTQATNTGVFRRALDGEEVQPDFVLIGEHDADVRIGDWYMKDGAKHEVVYVRDDRRYETWVEVKYRG